MYAGQPTSNLEKIKEKRKNLGTPSHYAPNLIKTVYDLLAALSLA